mgnify:CR=1 FL=1
MNFVTDAALIEAAALHPDPDFRALLSRLLTAIACDGEFDPGEMVRLVVIEPGDTLTAVEEDLSFTLTAVCEARDLEGVWTALTYILSDWGEGLLVFIPAQPDIDPTFLRLASETPVSR